MSTRRRTYSLLGGWLMSGKVLYCGNPSISTSDYDILTKTNGGYPYYYHRILAKDIDTSTYMYLISVTTSNFNGIITSSSSSSANCAYSHTFILDLSKLNMGQQDHSKFVIGLDTNLCISYFKDIGITLNYYYSGSSSYSGEVESVLIIAIPRTDI